MPLLVYLNLAPKICFPLSSPFGRYFARLILAVLPTLSFWAILLVAAPAGADSSDPSGLLWEELEPGLARSFYELTSPGAAIKSDVVLLKISLREFSVQAIRAEQFGKQRNDVVTLTKKVGGIAGINANFFDPEGKALGLVIQDTKRLNRLQNGGDLLTGIFFVRNGIPSIVHRSEFTTWDADTAIQAGPRLISNSKLVEDQQPQAPTRRSGIAITRSHDIILFTTRVRFPGASIGQIQRMLLQPSLDISDALNFDGGSSSQLYLEKVPQGEEPMWITGGDVVPVALVVKRK